VSSCWWATHRACAQFSACTVTVSVLRVLHAVFPGDQGGPSGPMHPALVKVHASGSIGTSAFLCPGLWECMPQHCVGLRAFFQPGLWDVLVCFRVWSLEGCRALTRCCGVLRACLTRHGSHHVCWSLWEVQSLSACDTREGETGRASTEIVVVIVVCRQDDVVG
jgi:hypothetical protein